MEFIGVTLVNELFSQDALAKLPSSLLLGQCHWRAPLTPPAAQRGHHSPSRCLPRGGATLGFLWETDVGVRVYPTGLISSFCIRVSAARVCEAGIHAQREGVWRVLSGGRGPGPQGRRAPGLTPVQGICVLCCGSLHATKQQGPLQDGRTVSWSLVSFCSLFGVSLPGTLSLLSFLTMQSTFCGHTALPAIPAPPSLWA